MLFAETVSYGQLGVQPLTLARFTLETGRSHQIRAQAAAQGFPLLGDLKYGRQKLDFPRPALHSCRLEFEHPMTQEKLIYEDPLPEDMRAIKPLEIVFAGKRLGKRDFFDDVHAKPACARRFPRLRSQNAFRATLAELIELTSTPPGESTENARS